MLEHLRVEGENVSIMHISLDTLHSLVYIPLRQPRAVCAARAKPAALGDPKEEAWRQQLKHLE
jgi:hypothetical protein